MERRTKEPDRAERILLADVARAYYLESASKIDIAARHGISRFQVAKLLDDALALGVVTIRIRDPRDQGSDLDERLAARLGIRRVDVVDTGAADAPGTSGAEQVGIAVMNALQEHVRAGHTIGISWSRTMDLAAKHFPDLPPCTIVQLAGALQNQGAGSLPAVIQRLGRSEDITTLPVHAPLVVGSPDTATDLMHQPEIAEALTRAGSLDLAVVAVGAWRAGESSVWEKVSATDRAAATRAGAVGEISGRLFDASGRAVHTALDARTIGVRLDQLATTPEIVAVARGVDRVAATSAALRGGFITHLVVDRPLADALLADAPPADGLPAPSDPPPDHS